MTTISASGEWVVEPQSERTVTRSVRRVVRSISIVDCTGDPRVAFDLIDQVLVDGVVDPSQDKPAGEVVLRLSQAVVDHPMLPMPDGSALPVLAVAAGLRALCEVRQGLHPDVWTPPPPPVADPPPEGPIDPRIIADVTT